MTYDIPSCRTVSTPSVMPPKAQPKTLAPKLSMLDEAKAIRLRHNKAWRTYSGHFSEHNARITETARKKRQELELFIIALLNKRPRTTWDLRRCTQASKPAVAAALRSLRLQGRAKSQREGQTIVWEVVV